MRRRRDRFPAARIEHRMAVLIPAYREDRVIDQSVEAILAQQYPRERYEAVVIADHCAPATLERLGQLPIRLLEVEFENSSKAKALNYAVAQLAAAGETFDMAVILDADNTVAPDFLSRLNDGYHSGAQAIQAHRRAKNLHTDTALLDAVSEEINNSIFRKGHVALGVSSALIGSGMAFDYNWFCNNITQVSSAGEDKELEVLLLKQGIFIEYLDDVEVLDEKDRREPRFLQPAAALARRAVVLAEGRRPRPAGRGPERKSRLLRQAGTVDDAPARPAAGPHTARGPRGNVRRSGLFRKMVAAACSTALRALFRNPGLPRG